MCHCWGHAMSQIHIFYFALSSRVKSSLLPIVVLRDGILNPIQVFLFRFPTLFLVPTIKLYQTISTTTSSNSFAQVTAMIISALSCLDEYLLFAKTLHSAKRCSMVSFILQHTLKHPPWTNPLAAFHDLVFTICSSTVMIEDVFLPCKFWLNQRWHLSSCSCA